MPKVSVSKRLAKAKTLEKRGENAEASASYEAVLAQFPENLDAKKGLLTLQLKDITGEIESGPLNLQFCYSRLLSLYERGQFGVALQVIQLAIDVYPRAYELWELLGATAKSLGKNRISLNAFNKAVGLAPNHAAAHNNLGTALRDEHQLEQAVCSYERAIELHPSFAEAHNNLGVVLRDLGRLHQSREHLLRAIHITPEYGQAFNNLGVVCSEEGLRSEAITAFEAALSIDPNNLEACFNLANRLSDWGRSAEATVYYKKFIAANPEKIDAWLYLAGTYRDLGQTTDAVDAYRRALSLDTHHFKTLQELADFPAFPVDDGFVAELQDLWRSKQLSTEDRGDLASALHKLCLRLDRTADAFYYIGEANRVRSSVYPFNAADSQSTFKALRDSASEYACSTDKVVGSESIPIFIVGMPRSGTTLVEQIVSSHRDVEPLGELPFIEEMVTSQSFTSERSTSVRCEQLHRGYWKKVAPMLQSKPFFTDKMPLNFRFIPMLAAAFPEAKFVHTYRDPSATCWSNYSTYFTDPGLNYSHDLGDTVAFYNSYVDLMTHFSDLLGSRIFHLNYELLTENQDGETRRLAKYLGFKFEQTMLSPHRNTRAVSTASRDQIRTPIYRNSSNKWKKFQPFVEDAFANLRTFRPAR